MNEKHKSLKTAYGMLSIPVIISAIILMVLSGGAIYIMSIALEDTNGGGWLLFGVILIAIVFFPSILAGVLQVIFFVAGIKKYKKNDIENVRTYGLISAISSIVGNAYIVLFGYRWFFNDEAEKDFYLLGVIAIAFIIYEAIIVGIFIKAKQAVDK